MKSTKPFRLACKYLVSVIFVCFVVTGCKSKAVGLSAGVDSNPLATDDQAYLDARLVKIGQEYEFAIERAAIRNQYLVGHGGTASAEAMARLDNAVDELVYGALASSVNGNTGIPRVHWLGVGAREWFGLSVPGSRWSFDNPDNAYRTVPIDPYRKYTITGWRKGSGPSDMSFSLINDRVLQGTEVFLDGKSLKVDADGMYQITIDSEAASGRANHMQSTSRTVQLFIRSNLGDWNREEHDLLHVTTEDFSTEELTDEQVANATRVFLSKAGSAYGVALLGLKTMANPVNTIPAPSMVATPGALVTQANSFGHFQIQDDECLIITLDPGGAEYFVVPATDPWMVGVDPARQISLNHTQSVADADGRFTFVLSNVDPGVHNWIDAAGLHEGTMMIRWQRLPSDGGRPAIEAQLAKLSELPALLPPETVYLSRKQRAEQLKMRRDSYLKRFRVP